MTPVLEDGMTLKPMGFNAKESELGARKLSREEVAAEYHVPLPMVGILDHATFSNIREQHKQLSQNCLGPEPVPDLMPDAVTPAAFAALQARVASMEGSSPPCSSASVDRRCCGRATASSTGTGGRSGGSSPSRRGIGSATSRSMRA